MLKVGGYGNGAGQASVSGMPSGVKLAIGVVLFLVCGVIVIHGYPIPDRPGLAREVETELAAAAEAALASPRGDGPYDWASVAFDGQVAALSGVAPDEAARGGAFSTVLQSTMTGGAWLGGVTKVIDQTCQPPLVVPADEVEARAEAMPDSRCENFLPGPYRFSAVRTGAGPVAVEGFAPSRRVRADIVAAAEDAFNGDFHQDHLRYALGAPDDADWAEAAAFGIEQLGRLRAGMFRLQGLTAQFEGTAGSDALREDVLADLGGFPEPFVLSASLQTAAPEPETQPDDADAADLAPPVVAPAAARPPNGGSRENAISAIFGVGGGASDEVRSSDLCQARMDALSSTGAITFEVSQSELRADSGPVLDLLADAARRCAGFRVTVTGHTDDSGDPVANLALSQARAEAVVSYLVAQGVERDRLRAVGVGSSEPRASNDTAAGRAENRRIEFDIIE